MAYTYLTNDNKKYSITITLNYYIIVNKIYLQNYNDKITGMIMN